MNVAGDEQETYDRHGGVGAVGLLRSRRNGGSRIATARQLGISERTLRYRLAAFREAGLAVAGDRR